MRVALVGPTGVLGRALVPLLMAKGFTVRLLARSAEKARRLFPEVAEVVECDLLAATAAELAFALLGCEAVAHIATAIPRDASAPDAWVANTRLRTEGVRKLLDGSLQAGAKRYLQQSITMAYADHGDEWITEDAPLDSAPQRAQVCGPVISMEGMVRDTPLEKLHWCILRGGSFVGKDTFQDDTIEGLRLGKTTVSCDGSNYVSFIHVDDIAAAFVAALERDPAGAVFNIVSEPLRQGDYLDRLAGSIGAPRPMRDASAPCPPSWRCSNQAARNKLSWLPRHSVIP